MPQIPSNLTAFNEYNSPDYKYVVLQEITILYICNMYYAFIYTTTHCYREKWLHLMRQRTAEDRKNYWAKEENAPLVNVYQ